MSTFGEIVNSEKPVLIDFYAEWCGPCKMMAPILKDVARQVGANAKVLKIDVDRNPELAQSLRVQGVPTLMIFQNGEVKWRQSGVVPAHSLVPILEQFMVKA
jgi:thioredoxin 1